MTMQELLALPNDELNRLAAEKVMRWTPRQQSDVWINADGKIYITSKKRYRNSGVFFHPATDHNDAATLLEEIRKRGLQVDFMHALETDILGGEIDFERRERFDLVNATARQKTVAAIAAVMQNSPSAPV